MAGVQKLLSFIRNEELVNRGKVTNKKRPNFFTGSNNMPSQFFRDGYSLQQSDLLRTFYLDIAENGLGTTSTPKDVVIVGAGIAGLVAGYELLRAGHSVTILEMTQRYGGRIKTFDEKDGFDHGLYSDAGAMRIPSRWNKDAQDLSPPEEGVLTLLDIHYLTDFYIRKFELESEVIPFINSDSNAYLKFYNYQSLTIDEWKSSPQEHFDNLWPGWNATILANGLDINNIEDYYDQTVSVVTNLLHKRLDGVSDINERAIQWDLWTQNWAQFSVDGFLRSKLEAIVPLIVFSGNITEADLSDLGNLLPWPEEALTAHSVYNYSGGLDGSLTSSLLSKLGKYGAYGMHTVEGGLSEIPKAIVESSTSSLKSCITYNRTVNRVVYYGDGNRKVAVHGMFTNSGEPFKVCGDAVIMTLPLNIVRQISIRGPPLDDFPREFQQAIEDVNYQASTKIMLQYRERFWDTDDHQIKGGFSKTNLPIGQVHYPSNEEEGPAANRKGILLVYTWKSEALLFGSLPEHVAVREAVDEIDRTIHPGSKKYFETGRVQAWYSDPASQGAYASLRPREYLSVMKLMTEPWKNVYFAGEAISFTNGWIQGALESALRTAYQFYEDNEELCG